MHARFRGYPTQTAMEMLVRHARTAYQILRVLVKKDYIGAMDVTRVLTTPLLDWHAPTTARHDTQPRDTNATLRQCLTGPFGPQKTSLSAEPWTISYLKMRLGTVYTSRARVWQRHLGRQA